MGRPAPYLPRDLLHWPRRARMYSNVAAQTRAEQLIHWDDGGGDRWLDRVPIGLFEHPGIRVSKDVGDMLKRYPCGAKQRCCGMPELIW